MYRLLIVIVIIISVTFTAFAQFPVMIYHANPNFGFSESMINDELDFLYNNDYHTVTPHQFYQWMINDEPMPIRPILLTFDDNYIGVYTVMYPNLQSRGFNMVNFAHSNYVGVPGANDHCDWIEINEMENSGIVITESHTKNHFNLAECTPFVAQDEIEGSKAAIDANIPEKNCRHIAYPYGAYNDDVITLCRNAGYVVGYSTIPGLNYRGETPLFEIKRQPSDSSSVSQFKQMIGYNNLPPAPPGEGWTIDNSDVNFTYDKSKWKSSTSTPGYYGDNYYVHPAGDGSDKARWAAYLPRGGAHRVHARWTSFSNRATNAVYEIHDQDGITTMSVNQQENGGQWNSLGIFNFTTDEAAMVYLSDKADAYVVADGIWFEPVTTRVSGWLLY
jgi:peptidoglycan/xylan/chitin deacetylase (PgdA/CDA1 family)